MEWTRSGNKYIHGSRESVPKLDPGVYRLNLERDGSLALVYVQEKFNLPAKIYGMDKQLIDQVTTAYASGVLTNNLGVILSGVKGTGKTVTAKQLCNLLGLPVILVDRIYDNFPSFVCDIKQDVLVFVDEYEKIYDRHESSLLSVMDGALDNGFKRVFILTTNVLCVSDNLIQRPGRIRYLKRYKDLDRETIELVVDDLLIHKELREQTIDFIASLQTITIDIVKALIDEVNIFHKPPSTFENIFNVHVVKDYYNIYDITPHEETRAVEPKLIHELYAQSHLFSTHHIGQRIYWDGRNRGTIMEIVQKDTVIVGLDNKLKVYYFVPCKKVHSAFKKKTRKPLKKFVFDKKRNKNDDDDNDDDKVELGDEQKELFARVEKRAKVDKGKDQVLLVEGDRPIHTEDKSPNAAVCYARSIKTTTTTST